MNKIGDKVFVIMMAEHVCECCGSYLDKEIISEGVVERFHDIGSSSFYTVRLQNNTTFNTPLIFKTEEAAEKSIDE